MNYRLLIFIIIVVFLVILDFKLSNIENKINKIVNKMGGKVLSITKNKSYIKEVDKIEKKRRLYTDTVYKVKYLIDNKEKIAYYVIYRSYFMAGKASWKYDWIEKD